MRVVQKMRQMGQESGKEKEGMGARREDWPPTLEHREREVCFAWCFYSGRSAMSANRVSRSRSGLDGGAAEQPVSLRTCAHSQPMHMHSVGATCCRCCCALLSFNYARRTSSSASGTLFPAPPRFSSSCLLCPPPSPYGSFFLRFSGPGSRPPPYFP